MQMDSSIAAKNVSLDTLETSVHILEQSALNPHKNIQKRRMRKALGQRMAKALCGVPNLYVADLKGYIRFSECNATLRQEGNKFTAYYCNHRACPVCQSIRSAKMIKAYKPQLDAIKDAYMVTLTDVNVKDYDLRKEYKRFSSNWSKIRQNIHTHNTRNPDKAYELKGIRTCECTHNWKKDDYNFHTHIIVSSEATAKRIVELHLRYHPTAKIDGQNITKADEGAYHELFKYVTKGITGDTYSAQVQHNIYSALLGMNQYYPFGGITKQVSEDVEELQSEVIELNDKQYGIWKFDISASAFGDWIEADGTPLLGDWQNNKKSNKYKRMIKTVDKQINHIESDAIKRRANEIMTEEMIQDLRSKLRFCLDNEIDIF